jgi:hypothetical protein
MERSRVAGRWYAIAALFAGLFALNVALRILFIKFHIAIWRLGDVGEMLLVLAAMLCFVSGVLSIQEESQPPAASPNDNPQGGQT